MKTMKLEQYYGLNRIYRFVLWEKLQNTPYRLIKVSLATDNFIKLQQINNLADKVFYRSSIFGTFGFF